MARPQKDGLDYFALDVSMDDEVELIEAEHGLEGFAILIKMFQKIYANGYFYKWTEREKLLFCKKVSSDRNKVESVINDCIKWGIFNEQLYDSYYILTSKRIQSHYIGSVYKRVGIQMIKEYLLGLDIKDKNIRVISLNDDTKKETPNVSDIRNQETSEVSDSESTQSKVNKSKEEEIKEKKINDDESPTRKNSIIQALVENNIVSPSGINATLREDLNDIFENFGFEDPDTMIRWAIKQAARGNGRTWRFVFNRLDLWRKEGINTAQAAEQFENRGFANRNRGKPPRHQEPMPKSMSSKPEQMDPQEVDKLRRQLEEKLRA